MLYSAFRFEPPWEYFRIVGKQETSHLFRSVPVCPSAVRI